MKSKIILSLFLASTLLSWGQGWVSLFDGKSFAGWEGNYHYFRIENNAKKELIQFYEEIISILKASLSYFIHSFTIS